MGEIADKALRTVETIAASERSEIWISVIEAERAREQGHEVERHLAGGERMPLAGVMVGVKDNIDVAGFPTTSACPAFATFPTAHAPCVQLLVDAGAVIVGKTNMDQFATGLVGTRSPYGVVGNAIDPRYVAGGSSSGSAVAVALGQVDLALGTDTAGSGRIPAAFNGVVGIKPTRGLISTRGTVPACVSLDCVSIFSRQVLLARQALEVMGRFDSLDPYSRVLERRSFGDVRTVGVPESMDLDITPDERRLFDRAIARLEQIGVDVQIVEIGPFLEAGAILYEGALVAERYSAVGPFILKHLNEVDHVVADIILGSAKIPAYELAIDQNRLAGLRRQVAMTFERVDALMLPTAPSHPTIDEVNAEPVSVNERLGLYTNFCNPLDLCAIALPNSATTTGLPWGITVFGPAFSDGSLANLGSRFLGERASSRDVSNPETQHGQYPLVVSGAHLRGQPLNGELTSLGAMCLERTTTAPCYRFYRLGTEPAKPALVYDIESGRPIEVEVWALDAEGFASVISQIPPPMAIGPVQLIDGRWLPGFVCQPTALTGAVEISAYGGWRRYLS